jgi:hypothetical protein
VVRKSAPAIAVEPETDIDEQPLEAESEE